MQGAVIESIVNDGVNFDVTFGDSVPRQQVRRIAKRLYSKFPLIVGFGRYKQCINAHLSRKVDFDRIEDAVFEATNYVLGKNRTQQKARADTTITHVQRRGHRSRGISFRQMFPKKRQGGRRSTGHRHRRPSYR